MEQILKDFVNSRDNNGEIIAAFGYGSGIFKQNGYSLQKPMIDTIFVVEKPRLWHKENIKKNPKDYSRNGRIILKYFDLNAIRKSTGVTYQCDIPFQGYHFKYGIISKKRFLDYLNGNWESFFIQGRFKKPTYPIRTTYEIDKAIQENRDLALFVALLTLDVEHPTLVDLYNQICSLSYLGDVRMFFAENPNKIHNIVNGSFKDFYDIYGEDSIYFYTKQNGELVINYDLLYAAIRLLPDTLYHYIEKHGNCFQDHKKVPELIQKKLAQINRKDSLIQPSLGLLTVSPSKSVAYLNEKMKKKKKKL